MNNNISDKMTQSNTSEKLPWVIISIGIALRLIRYLHNTPLWFDESVIAADIINRPLTAFIHTSPDYTQTGPLSFYMLTKLSTMLFGNSEHALRLIPFLFGVVSLILFYYAARKIVSPGAVPIALALFAVLDPLVYYSTELKPYSGDVMFAVLILAAVPFSHNGMKIRDIAFFALAGVIAALSSNPSVFMLAGVGAGLILHCLLTEERAKFRGLMIVSIIWSAGFIAIYLLYTRNLTASMSIGMEKAFAMEKFQMPFPPASLLDIKWFIDFFFDTFLFQDNIMYIRRVTLSGLMAFTFLAGSVIMFSGKRDRFYVLTLPIIITFTAAAMHMYPFKGRQILFLVPMFLLIISEGAEYIRSRVSAGSALIGVVFIGLMFIYPVSWAAYHVKKPIVRSEARPVLNYIEKNWRDGDILYVHFFAQYEFNYYTKHHPVPFEFNDKEFVIGTGPRGWYNIWRRDNIPEIYRNIDSAGQTKKDLLMVYRDEINDLSKFRRAWILFTGDITMESFFISTLDAKWKMIDTFGHSGLAKVYLYNLEAQVE